MPFDQAQWQIDIIAADRTAQAFSSVEKRMKSLEQQLGGVTRGMQQSGSEGAGAFSLITRAALPALAIIEATALAWRAWNAGMQSGGLIDAAAQLGTTTDALQAFRLTAMQSGVEAGQFDSALQRLVGQMGQANAGSEEAINRFDKLGVKLLTADGRLRPINDVLPEVARGLLAASSETERNALAQDIFGRSGSRIVTMLEALARGTDAVTAAARVQGAVVERDTLEAWNKLDAQLKVTRASSDATLASLGAPIATWALEQVNNLLVEINANIAKLKMEGRTLAGRAAGVDVQNLEEQLAVQKNLLAINPNNKMAQSSVTALERRLAEARSIQRAQESADAAGILVGDTPRYVPPVAPGAKQPPAKASGGGSKTDDGLREAQRQMDELVASIERIRKESEGVLDRFGDGSAYAARETEKLNEMLQLGYLDAGTHARALEEVTKKADDMGRAYRGAAGGADAFVAGISQGLADLDRANSAFELGKRLADDVSEAFTNLATGAEVDFGKIALSWANMLIQMEMKAAASNIWNAITGKGSTDQGIGGWLGGLLGLGGGGGVTASAPMGIGDIISGAGSLAGGWMPGFADGGRPPVGRPSVVGEKGWEVFVPDRPGTIYNQDQLAGMSGDRQMVNVYQTVQVGSVVSRAEHERDLAAVEERARKGAIAGVLEARGTSSSFRRAFRG